MDITEYKPFVSHSAEFDSSIPKYEKTVPLEWNAVEFSIGKRNADFCQMVEQKG